jgi:hypothetical protein
MLRKHSPPLAERVARGVGHLMFLVGAVWGVGVDLPTSVAIAADPAQLSIWGVFMGSGAVAAFAAWRGLYLIEYAVIPAMLAGVLIYVAAIANVVVTGENPGSGLALFLMIALASYLSARWFSLNQLLDGPLKLLFKRRQGSDG